MSTLGSLGHFFLQVGRLAPIILAATPLAPIAPAVTAAIQEAEALAGSGPDKRAHVLAIVLDAATAAQLAGVPINLPAVQTATGQTIDTIIAVVKAAHPVVAPPVSTP